MQKKNQLVKRALRLLKWIAQTAAMQRKDLQGTSMHLKTSMSQSHLPASLLRGWSSQEWKVLKASWWDITVFDQVRNPVVCYGGYFGHFCIIIIGGCCCFYGGLLFLLFCYHQQHCKLYFSTLFKKQWKISSDNFVIPVYFHSFTS